MMRLNPSPILRLLYCSTALLLYCSVSGCQPATETRIYDIELSNHLTHPVTVFLTKNGPPDEYGWLSPEQIAENPMSHDPAHVGQTVPPGSTARSGQVVGHFYSATSAILRIYAVTGGLEDYAAISADNPKRADMLIHPGLNRFVVTPAGPGILVQRREEPDN